MMCVSIARQVIQFVSLGPENNQVAPFTEATLHVFVPDSTFSTQKRSQHCQFSRIKTRKLRNPRSRKGGCERTVSIADAAAGPTSMSESTSELGIRPDQEAPIARRGSSENNLCSITATTEDSMGTSPSDRPSPSKAPTSPSDSGLGHPLVDPSPVTLSPSIVMVIAPLLLLWRLTFCTSYTG